MTYSDFYDIAVYVNDNWKGNFTEKEIAEMAYEYTVAFEESKASEDADAVIVIPMCEPVEFPKKELPIHPYALASGISIKKENMDKFTSYIEETLPELKFDESTEVDIRINVYDINRVLIDCIKKIDRVSGTNFKPVKVFIDGITDYTIGMMSDYKHLVIKPNDYTMIIKWNFDGSFDDMEDHSMMNDELEICCSLDSGFLGRNFYLKAICDEIREAV